MLAGLAFFHDHLGLTASANAAHRRTPTFTSSLTSANVDDIETPFPEAWREPAGGCSSLSSYRRKAPLAIAAFRRGGCGLSPQALASFGRSSSRSQLDRRDDQQVSAVDEARPNTSEIASPWKIGSVRMKAAPIIAAAAVRTIGLNRVAPASISAGAQRRALRAARGG